MSNQYNNLLWSIDSEGLDYAIRCYSDWKEIDDPIFHKLKDAFVAAGEELERYLSNFQVDEDPWDDEDDEDDY